jgi:hypothetical protein
MPINLVARRRQNRENIRQAERLSYNRAASELGNRLGCYRASASLAGGGRQNAFRIFFQKKVLAAAIVL